MYITIKANTTSDFLDVSHLVMTEEAMINVVLPLVEKAFKILIYNLDINDYTTSLNYYVHLEYGDFICSDEDIEEDICFMKNYPKYSDPEERLDSTVISITRDGRFYFKTWGKYTSDEVWTESIYYEDIVRRIHAGKMATQDL